MLLRRILAAPFAAGFMSPSFEVAKARPRRLLEASIQFQSRGVATLVMAVFASAFACGEVIFLEPTPYLSKADSPFDMSGLGTTFFFEDFEDGSLDFPDGVYGHPYDISQPGQFTDSVDGDDGKIDGSGTGGRSFRPNGIRYVNLAVPPQWIEEYFFVFNAKELGFAPTMFGFTYTDAMQSSYLVVSVVDDNGRTEHYYPVTLDGTYEGGTNEDRFIGFISSVGIRQVEILNAFFGLGYVATLEFDHIQFGNTVPELHYQLSPLVFTSLLLRNFKRST